MVDIKQFLGIIATFIAFISYIPYFRDILKSKTKPHAFTWLIWGTLTFIAFLGQLYGNAGPGAWSSGLTVIICVLIFLLASIKSRANIKRIDFLILILAVLSIFLWLFSKQPTYSIILITITDIFGFIPTVRKSWVDPNDETIITYVLNILKHILSIMAIENYSIVTTLYPAYLVIANALFVSLLIVRKKTYTQN